MSRDLLFFGTAQTRLTNALTSLKAGGGVIVVDDDDRENEGDLIFPACTLTEKQMAMLIRFCSGIVCLCIPSNKASALDLPPMVPHNTSSYGTAFTVSIEAAQGVTTGVSAHDRVRTVKSAIADSARPEDLRRPGHVFPLAAKDGGVLERPGHTEATVDLMALAGLPPYGVLCELTNDDGSMCCGWLEIQNFACTHDLPVLSVGDIIEFRRNISCPCV